MSHIRKFTIAFLLLGTGVWAGCTANEPGQMVSFSQSSNGDWIQPSGDHSTAANYQPIRVLKKSDNLVELMNNAKGPVLIDFYADWCGPCQKQSGVLTELRGVATERMATILKIDVDQFPELASQFRVTSLPTLIAFDGGGEVQRVQGFADKSRVASLLAITPRLHEQDDTMRSSMIPGVK